MFFKLPVYLYEFMAQQPFCEVVMEACYSGHNQTLSFTQMEHTVRLPPARVVEFALRLPASIAGNTSLSMQERV